MAVDFYRITHLQHIMLDQGSLGALVERRSNETHIFYLHVEEMVPMLHCVVLLLRLLIDVGFVTKK